MGELVRDTGSFVKFVMWIPLVLHLSLSLVIKFCPSKTKEERGTPLQILREEIARELFLYLLPLNCLRLKITLMSSDIVWGGSFCSPAFSLPETEAAGGSNWLEHLNGDFDKLLDPECRNSQLVCAQT